MSVLKRLQLIFSVIICLFLINVFCQKAPDYNGKLLDMTYPFDDSSIYWPNANSFKLIKGDWGKTDGGYYYASNEFSAAEHGGTHADAPVHFAENGRTIDRIPLQEWIGPAIKIDVTGKCAGDRNYLLTVEDIQQWEQNFGPVPDDSWVIMYTGIDTKYYPDKLKVLGTDKTGPAAIPELSFPGYSPEAAQFLTTERNIKGIVIDTPSIDYGKSTEFLVHQIMFAADKLALENIANLDLLPTKGATLFVIPMLIKDGTGAPARVFALLP